MKIIKVGMKMKRRRANFGRIISFLLLLLVIFGLAIYGLFFKENMSNDKDSNPITNEEEEEDKPKEYCLDMLMVGDVLVHGNVYNDAKVGDGYDFSPMFDDVRDMVKTYDLAFYNQETPFAGKELGYSGYPLFNTPSEVGDAMLDMGFNLVSLATNHTLDKGSTGAINNINYWSGKQNVLSAGSYLSEEARNKDIIKEKNGIKYTMFAYTTFSNLTIPSGKSYLLNVYDKEKVKEDIERVRDKVDLLIVSMHWGTENSNTPNAQQKEIASYLASLGVDIIIGTHTHTVQPIEYINGTLVFYSLGNFISSQLEEDLLIGLMPTLKVTKKVEDGKTSINISNLDARLVYTYYKGIKQLNKLHTDHKVIPFEDLTTTIFPDYKEYYEKYKEILTSLDSSIQVEPISE
jgi:poly-gamma-glutamate synthesis protein (capsule biosynthesis protein)